VRSVFVFPILTINKNRQKGKKKASVRIIDAWKKPLLTQAGDWLPQGTREPVGAAGNGSDLHGSVSGCSVDSKTCSRKFFARR